MKSSFTYFGNYIIETIVDGDEVHYNMMPNLDYEPAIIKEDLQSEENIVNPVAQPLQANTNLSLEAPGRTKPALVRGLYTFLTALAGMFAAGLAYVQANFDMLMNSISWRVIIVVVVGAVIAGFLYFLKKFYKPEGTW